MTRESLAKAYEAGRIERKWYDYWLAHGYFTPQIDPNRKPFVIVMPPPNVTGELHVGHALTMTIEDVLIRWHRMLGEPTLWVPGTDHSGIAVQVLVEKDLASEGLTREQVGREEFLRRAWERAIRSRESIRQQQYLIGSSCDWTRDTFTLDEAPSRAVRTAFVRLYRKGLIYRGERMVNWCPRCLTALSDLEVEHKDTAGHLYHFQYPLADGSGSVTIATTRPETCYGDTAVAVNPADVRYRTLIGRKVILPVSGREIPLIGDDAVDPSFGSGALKITPSHDPTDLEIAERHQLPHTDVFNPDASMNSKAGTCEGMTREDCRLHVVHEFARQGLLLRTEPYAHMVGYCGRCGSAIEPRLSLQWFVLAKPLAEPAIRVVRDGEIRIVPEHFTRVYFSWMESIKDWCISRQLWWGHRIPVWYCAECGSLTVSVDTPEGCDHCASKSIEQDPDVLDTWFSSWLWPIAVFDGIRNPDNREINYYYPTNDLVTAPEILFFWVARMIMAGHLYREEIPFKNVYLTGIVRDKLGRKMSKQLGNSPDPITLMERYGADGVRAGMLFTSPAGNDLPFDEALCEQGRNFCNKIWNALRLVKGWPCDDRSEQPEHAAVATAWFNAQLNATIEQMEEMFTKYRLSEALITLYKLIWDDFCSWYLEMIKPPYQQPIDKATLDATIGYFESLMKLLHPFMPFISEEIWHHLAERTPGDDLMVASPPSSTGYDEKIRQQFDITREVIMAIRNHRKEKSIPNKEPLEMYIKGDFPTRFIPVLTKIGNLKNLFHTGEIPHGTIATMVKTLECAFPVSEQGNTLEERARIQKELQYLKGFLKGVEAKLSNEKFMAGAPEKVVQNEQKKQQDTLAKITALEKQLALLGD